MKMSISPSFPFPLRKKREIFFPASRGRQGEGGKRGIPYSVPVAGTDRERGVERGWEKGRVVSGEVAAAYFSFLLLFPARVG